MAHLLNIETPNIHVLSKELHQEELHQEEPQPEALSCYAALLAKRNEMSRRRQAEPVKKLLTEIRRGILALPPEIITRLPRIDSGNYKCSEKNARALAASLLSVTPNESRYRELRERLREMEKWQAFLLDENDNLWVTTCCHIRNFILYAQECHQSIYPYMSEMASWGEYFFHGVGRQLLAAAPEAKKAEIRGALLDDENFRKHMLREFPWAIARSYGEEKYHSDMNALRLDNKPRMLAQFGVGRFVDDYRGWGVDAVVEALCELYKDIIDAYMEFLMAEDHLSRFMFCLRESQRPSEGIADGTAGKNAWMTDPKQMHDFVEEILQTPRIATLFDSRFGNIGHTKVAGNDVIILGEIVSNYVYMTIAMFYRNQVKYSGDCEMEKFIEIVNRMIENYGDDFPGYDCLTCNGEYKQKIYEYIQSYLQQNEGDSQSLAQVQLDFPPFPRAMPLRHLISHVTVTLVSKHGVDHEPSDDEVSQCIEDYNYPIFSGKNVTAGIAAVVREIIHSARNLSKECSEHERFLITYKAAAGKELAGGQGDEVADGVERQDAEEEEDGDQGSNGGDDVFDTA
ncbi:MAG: hypothetical protein LBC42_01725 [Puniceicoccales bacterium]|jgi:hypothetical protein|nr:hypothetical protein [Puniceicoccales bacterium]